MTSDLSTRSRSRRALLAGGVSAIAALVAATLGRPIGAAAEGETVEVGGEYPTATSRTLLRNRVNDRDVLVARSDGQGVALRAQSRGTAVDAHSALGSAVGARSDGAYAQPGDAGVEGGVALSGYATFGHGAAGASQSGTGVYAYSETGTALHVNGRLRVDGASGVAIIPAGATFVDVRPFPFAPVPRSSLVLLTPTTDIGSRSLWFSIRAAEDEVRIHLSSARSGPTRVAWLLLG